MPTKMEMFDAARTLDPWVFCNLWTGRGLDKEIEWPSCPDGGAAPIIERLYS